MPTVSHRATARLWRGVDIDASRRDGGTVRGATRPTGTWSGTRCPHRLRRAFLQNRLATVAARPLSARTPTQTRASPSMHRERPAAASCPASSGARRRWTVGPISRVLPTRRFLPALTKRSRPARGRAMHRPRRGNSRRMGERGRCLRFQRNDCCSAGTSSCQVASASPPLERAGAMGGPVDGRPRWSRMAFTGPGCVR